MLKTIRAAAEAADYVLSLRPRACPSGAQWLALAVILLAAGSCGLLFRLFF
jgi:hypothetical protein